MFGPRQQVLLTPLEKSAKRDFRDRADLYVISVRPDIQTDQHHTDTHGAIQLKQSSMLAQTEKVEIPSKLPELVSK